MKELSMSTENETMAMIDEFRDTPETQHLINRLEKILDDETGGTVLAALTYFLMREHICMNVVDDDWICDPCSNVELTQLFQALRHIKEELLEDIPRRTHQSDH